LYQTKVNDLDDEDLANSPDKVSQRQQHLALLGIDTLAIVPKASKPAGSGSNPVSQGELDSFKTLLKEQIKKARSGIFEESQHKGVRFSTLLKLTTIGDDISKWSSIKNQCRVG
jgi:hypothetical protein